MTTATAERNAQALAHINELITAVAGVQALISAGVESPFVPTLTIENLGKAYHYLTDQLAQQAILASL